MYVDSQSTCSHLLYTLTLWLTASAGADQLCGAAAAADPALHHARTCARKVCTLHLIPSLVKVEP